MHLTSVVDAALTAVLVAILGWAALSDVRTRKIPNTAVLAVLGLFVVWTLAGHLSTLGDSAIGGVVALVLTYLLYTTKILGAGDAKLFAALALFPGLRGLEAYALATVWAGGLLAIASVTIRSGPVALMMLATRTVTGESRGVPYGLAIALGGSAVQTAHLFGVLRAIIP
jgi:prepilin peptidase CpaA